VDDGTLEMPVSSVDQTSSDSQSMSVESQESTTTVIKRSLSYEKLGVEFAKTTDKIKQALIRNNINVHSLIQQLSTIPAVKDQKVPLFDENIFKRVRTMDDLWNILRNHWAIDNYDILTYVVDMAECTEATSIYDSFMATIDSATLKDIPNIALRSDVYEGQGLKPQLRVKVGEKECTPAIITKVKKVVSKKFKLKDYTLNLKGIKDGCIELIYDISNALELYLLQCKLTGQDLVELATHNIMSLQIGDMKLTVPSEFGKMVGIFVLSLFCRNKYLYPG